jgi:hypothetical protein
MMHVYEDQTFERVFDRDSAATFCDAEFRRCRFQTCALSVTLSTKLRSTARDLKLINCEEKACGIWGAIVEEVVVDGLKTSDMLQTWAAVFKHVVLRGRIGRIMISNRVAPVMEVTSEHLQAFSQANAAYYAKVDWALDISQAEFQDCDIRGVPARLIRRDPETQVVVTRPKALAGEWRRLDLGRTHWPTAIEFMLEREDEDAVLVAPKRARNFKDLHAGLKLLREAGVAEPG